jgi:hypothetical protein
VSGFFNCGEGSLSQILLDCFERLVRIDVNERSVDQFVLINLFYRPLVVLLLISLVAKLAYTDSDG